jgi:hypothetical protein
LRTALVRCCSLSRQALLDGLLGPCQQPVVTVLPCGSQLGPLLLCRSWCFGQELCAAWSMTCPAARAGVQAGVLVLQRMYRVSTLAPLRAWSQVHCDVYDCCVVQPLGDLSCVSRVADYSDISGSLLVAPSMCYICCSAATPKPCQVHLQGCWLLPEVYSSRHASCSTAGEVTSSSTRGEM